MFHLIRENREDLLGKYCEDSGHLLFQVLNKKRNRISLRKIDMLSREIGKISIVLSMIV